MRWLAAPLLLCACHRPPAPVAPCADGTWAGWTDPEGLVHVTLAGSDTEGDGTWDHPFVTLARAVQAAPPGEELRVAMGPGAFTGNVRIAAGDGGRVTVQGCSAKETSLHGEADPGRGDEAVVVEGAVAVRRLTILSTGPGLVARKGSDLTVEAVRIEGASHFGLSAIGPGRVTLRDLHVERVDQAGGHRGLSGWGLLLTGVDVGMDDVTVLGAVAMGVYQKGGSLQATDLHVEGVGDTGKGRRGFGVQLQGLTEVALDDCLVSNVAGGGIYVVDAGRARVTGCVVERVGGGEEPGDGILVARRKGDGLAPVTLTGNTVRGAARMGIVLAGVDATLSGNVAGADNGQSVDGLSVYADEEARVTGGSAASFDRSALRILRASGRWPDGAARRAP